MAHYAFLDENNIVTEVIVGIDETELIDGLNPEIWYGNFRKQICKRTSYNTVANKRADNGIPFRGNYAGIGMIYDSELDAFYYPQPYPSWTLDKETFIWVAPVPMPETSTSGSDWIWNEENKSWVTAPYRTSL
jgi:hypothetical protein